MTVSAQPGLINTFIINVRGGLKFLRVDFVRLVCGELSQKLRLREVEGWVKKGSNLEVQNQTKSGQVVHITSY